MADPKPDPTKAPPEMERATLEFARKHNAKLAQQARSESGHDGNTLRGGGPPPRKPEPKE